MNNQFDVNSANTDAVTTFKMYVLVHAQGGANPSAVDIDDRAALRMHQVKVASDLSTDDAAQDAWAQLNHTLAIGDLSAVEAVAIDPRSMKLVSITHMGRLRVVPTSQPAVDKARGNFAAYILIQPKAGTGAQSMEKEDRKALGMHRVNVPRAMLTDEACVFAWYVVSQKLAISDLSAVQVVGIDPRSNTLMSLDDAQSEIERLARTRDELTLA